MGCTWVTGRIFDLSHSYNLAWGIMTAAAVLGAGAIYAVSVRPGNRSPVLGITETGLS